MPAALGFAASTAAEHHGIVAAGQFSNLAIDLVAQAAGA
jgi:hypothetical protein